MLHNAQVPNRRGHNDSIAEHKRRKYNISIGAIHIRNRTNGIQSERGRSEPIDGCTGGEKGREGGRTPEEEGSPLNGRPGLNRMIKVKKQEPVTFEFIIPQIKWVQANDRRYRRPITKRCADDPRLIMGGCTCSEEYPGVKRLAAITQVLMDWPLRKANRCSGRASIELEPGSWPAYCHGRQMSSTFLVHWPGLHRCRIFSMIITADMRPIWGRGP